MASSEQCKFLDPIHHEKSKYCKDWDDGLEGGEKANKEEVMNEIDILKAYLKLHFLTDLVKLVLIEEESSF